MKLGYVAAGVTLGLLLVGLKVGCGCKTAWRECQGSAPYIGPEVMAKDMRREVRSLALYMTANGHRDESVWKGCGKRVDQGQVRREVEAYLVRSRFYRETVDETEVSFSTDVRNPDALRLPQKVAPYKLCVVSLCPTVVLMIPFDYGYDAPRKAITRPGEESEWGRSLGLFPLAGGLHAGTSFPYQDGLLWFRPDSVAEPQPVSRAGSAAGEIRAGDVHLDLTREQNQLRVIRRQ